LKIGPSLIFIYLVFTFHSKELERKGHYLEVELSTIDSCLLGKTFYKATCIVSRSTKTLRTMHLQRSLEAAAGLCVIYTGQWTV